MLVLFPVVAFVFAGTSFLVLLWLLWALGVMKETQLGDSPGMMAFFWLPFLGVLVGLGYLGYRSEDEELMIHGDELTYFASRAGQKSLARRANSLASHGVKVSEAGMRRSAVVKRSAITDLRLEECEDGERLVIAVAGERIAVGRRLTDADREWLLEALRRWQRAWLSRPTSSP